MAALDLLPDKVESEYTHEIDRESNKMQYGPPCTFPSDEMGLYTPVEHQT